MNLVNFLLVGIGGTIGAILRYSIALIIDFAHFPLATLIANLIGSFLLGFILSWNEERPLSNSTLLLLGTGIMGSLTTMSTFAVETINTGIMSVSVLNIVITLIGVLFGALLGKYLATVFV